MPAYRLPDLPYNHSALEPHISGRIMELHHDKHDLRGRRQQGARAARRGACQGRLYPSRRAREGASLQPVGAHPPLVVLAEHDAEGWGTPEGELAETLQRDFGGFDQFKKQLGQTAATIMGSGWAALVWEPLGGHLLTTQIYDHQLNLSQGAFHSS